VPESVVPRARHALGSPSECTVSLGRHHVIGPARDIAGDRWRTKPPGWAPAGRGNKVHAKRRGAGRTQFLLPSHELAGQAASEHEGPECADGGGGGGSPHPRAKHR